MIVREWRRGEHPDMLAREWQRVLKYGIKIWLHCRFPPPPSQQYYLTLHYAAL